MSYQSLMPGHLLEQSRETKTADIQINLILIDARILEDKILLTLNIIINYYLLVIIRYFTLKDSLQVESSLCR